MRESLSVGGTMSQAALSNRISRSRWFFPCVSGGLLAAVLIGFSPTFYLRTFFNVSPIPAYLYVHGVVLTAWFVSVFAQTCLVAAHRTDLHRRLGVLAVLDGVLVVLVSTFVTVRAVPRYVANGMDPAQMQFIVIGDLVSLVVFATLLAAAVRFRRRPEWHKRFMTVCCFIIIGPAIARLERLGLGAPVPAVLLLLLVVLAVYDFIGLRRLHRATIWSSLLVLIALAAVLRVVGTTAGSAVVDALR
jgi:hypothetical protein